MSGRRRFLATTAAAIGAGLVPIAAAGGVGSDDTPDAELLALCAAFIEAEAAVQANNLNPLADDEATGRVVDDWYELLNQITDTPALTLAGLRAKARAAHIAMTEAEEGGGFGHEEAAAMSVLAALAG